MHESNWGRWGNDDERGALNLLTPEVVRNSTGAVKTGKVYPLAIPIARSGPHLAFRGAPQRFTLVNYSDEREVFTEGFGGTPGIGANEDVVVMATHTATHMDALSHVYADGKLYNGYSREAVTPYNGAGYCSIDNVGAVATRGILLDIPALKGVDHLDFGYGITDDDVRAALKRQEIDLREGDAVLVRTGWVELFEKTQEFRLDQAGLDLSAIRMLNNADVSIVGADNTTVEVQPWSEGSFLGGHIEFLVKAGVNLIEHLALGALAHDEAHEFMFVTAPLPIEGASGSPVVPVAIA